MQEYAQAFAFVAALTQSDPNTAIIDVRMIHDTNKAVAAIPRRGVLPQLWNEIVQWNNQGYGAFININDMDGTGHEIGNVRAIRCQAIDLDGISASVDYSNAIAFNPAPAFAVQSSPGKFHVYWTTTLHNDRDRFYTLQRKLRTLFNGDRKVIDPSRVLRIPGTYHLKNPLEPHLITCWSLAGYGQPIDPTYLELALSNVNIVDGGLGERKELGDVSLQAPGLDWCIKALQECDPNTLDRGDWVGMISAFKQAAWNFAPENQLIDLFMKWCEHYRANDPAENLKNWNSIRNTQIGWPWIEFRNPNLRAMRLFGEKQHTPTTPTTPTVAPSTPPSTPSTPVEMPLPSGEFMTYLEQQQLFKGCVFIERMGEILTPDGRFMNATKFNGKFGGKNYIISSTGKTTNEPWAAATRSTLWTIPKADHIRFLPMHPQGEFIKDALGRIGVNTYKPPIIDARPGDITPFLRHMNLLLPDPSDQKILFDFLAHNAKFPGFKIPWAPLIQSGEGAGKGMMIKQLVKHMLGAPYVYFPKAQELIDSGSKFNSWMRSKLFILVDEIKVDERRDMIEILKPMITEPVIEIQAKGIDQDQEDNPANWCFFSNYRDAIPVNKNSRRFAIFYSAMQTVEDILANGLNDAYFTALSNWMESDGAAFVTHWLQNYPIERGSIPMRAPVTSSTNEAVRQSRGPVESLILEAVEDGLPGFRGGYVSTLAVMNRIRGSNVRAVSTKLLGTILESLGYHAIGRAPRPYWEESKDHRADIFSLDRRARIDGFVIAQGYMGG